MRAAAPLDDPLPDAPRGRAPAPHNADVVAAAGVCLAGALAAFALPPGSLLRMAAGAVALVAPGYLLLQASLPQSSRRERLVHVVVALGLGPAVAALCALALALVPGMFRPAPIVAFVTATSVALALVAVRRRTAEVPAVAVGHAEGTMRRPARPRSLPRADAEGQDVAAVRDDTFQSVPRPR
ncbi:MAG: DUF1616 domain-containing protein [bacterium]